MRSKNQPRLSDAEGHYLARVKMLPWSVCDAPPISDAHHIKQGQHFLVIPLCRDCHQGRNGWHGEKTIWRIKKMDELDALAIAIERLMR